jgi:hypothetical protein
MAASWVRVAASLECLQALLGFLLKSILKYAICRRFSDKACENTHFPRIFSVFWQKMPKTP